MLRNVKDLSLFDKLIQPNTLIGATEPLLISPTVSPTSRRNSERQNLFDRYRSERNPTHTADVQPGWTSQRKGDVHGRQTEGVTCDSVAPLDELANLRRMHAAAAERVRASPSLPQEWTRRRGLFHRHQAGDSVRRPATAGPTRGQNHSDARASFSQARSQSSNHQASINQTHQANQSARRSPAASEHVEVDTDLLRLEELLRRRNREAQLRGDDVRNSLQWEEEEEHRPLMARNTKLDISARERAELIAAEEDEQPLTKQAGVELIYAVPSWESWQSASDPPASEVMQL
mmetsp:Transcript_42091/g.70232  ORF Transcript_42091/g.70232 Transcript_42091/m.70232 type:complete len:290 (-) Transcript_42091:418-1287(-)